MLKLGGTEDARHQGTPLVEGEKLYLRQVPREQVAGLIASLIDFWREQRSADESMGAFHRRVGHAAILARLRADPRTASLTLKTAPAPYVAEAS
jgi:sulfite reductase beta subunit-like hemoprotein